MIFYCIFFSVCGKLINNFFYYCFVFFVDNIVYFEMDILYWIILILYLNEYLFKNFFNELNVLDEIF